MIKNLSEASWQLAALGALFESGVLGELTEPRTTDELATRCPRFDRDRLDRCLAVAAALGVVGRENERWVLGGGARCVVASPMAPSMVGALRTSLQQPLALLDAATGPDGGSGWHHDDPGLLQAQGDASGAFAWALEGQLADMLPGLRERLAEPGARFLDVGVGVGALAIEMCRAFPEVGVVGLDLREEPLAVARDNVARAGLADRIELRRQGVADMTDEGVFDLVWLPSFFIAAADLPAAATCLRRSLREGGWALFSFLGPRGEGSSNPVEDLVATSWGGPVLSNQQAETILREADLKEVRTLPGPPWVPGLAVARR